MTSMLRSRVRPLLPVLLTVGVTASAAALRACGTADEVRSAVDPVEEAIAATARADGAKLEMRMSFGVPDMPRSFAMTARGATNMSSGETQLTMDMGAFGEALKSERGAPTAGDLDIELRIVDGRMYMHMGALAGQLLGGKTWVGIDIEQMGKQLGLDINQLTQAGDPARILDYLRDAGSVKEIGRAQVRGVATTHYRATLDLGKAVEALGGAQPQSEDARKALEKLLPEGGLPADVWIDDDNLLRRMEMNIVTADESAGGDMSMKMRFDLYDYGTKVSVEAPPADQVADGSRLFGAAATAAGSTP